MRTFSLERAEIFEKLNKQVVHMDQGVCYAPEYAATREMRYYPSRVAQIIRAVFLKELDASEYGADIVFTSILSGQGERWQNFGEKPDDFLLSSVLGREIFADAGMKAMERKALKEGISANGGHIESVLPEKIDVWKEFIPQSEKSNVALFLDDMTCETAAEYAERMGDLLRRRDIECNPDIGPWFAGFEYLAAGMVDDGIRQLTSVIEKLKSMGIRKVITLSGQSQYVLSVLSQYLGIQHSMEVISIFDLMEPVCVDKAYVYGGSFNTRFLGMSNRINDIFANDEETIIPNSWEFVPLLDAENRVNKVGIYGAPLTPEYIQIGGNQAILEEIYKNGVNEIQRSGCRRLIVCDPYAWRALVANKYAGQMTYYMELL